MRILARDSNRQYQFKRLQWSVIEDERLEEQVRAHTPMHNLTKAHLASKLASTNKDQVYFDHRASGCMFEARSQLACGACYAFVAIALAEWLHCIKTGQLVAFSEQYMIDCGHLTELTGCSGGSMDFAADFIHNYGVELRSTYPYRARNDSCPYGARPDRKLMGHIRMEYGVGAYIQMYLFEKYIEHSPIIVGISTRGSFLEYGGGVYDSGQCQTRAGHVVLLVVHGIEDGQQYWLVRNSHLTRWGEQGHMKLAKGSKCIRAGMGMVHGTSDGRRFSFRPRPNTRHQSLPLARAQA